MRGNSCVNVSLLSPQGILLDVSNEDTVTSRAESPAAESLQSTSPSEAGSGHELLPGFLCQGPAGSHTLERKGSGRWEAGTLLNCAPAGGQGDPSPTL